MIINHTGPSAVELGLIAARRSQPSHADGWPGWRTAEIGLKGGAVARRAAAAEAPPSAARTQEATIISVSWVMTRRRAGGGGGVCLVATPDAGVSSDDV